MLELSPWIQWQSGKPAAHEGTRVNANPVGQLDDAVVPLERVAVHHGAGQAVMAIEKRPSDPKPVSYTHLRAHET